MYICVMLKQEIETFNRHLKELQAHSLGKYVLIKGDAIVGTYVAIEDALSAGYTNFKDEPFLVREILNVYLPLNFTNTLLAV
jgi:hypothetical protein